LPQTPAGSFDRSETPLGRALQGTGLAATCLFALAASWSIAAAQSAIVLGAVVVVTGVLLRAVRYPRLPLTIWAILAFLAVQAVSIPLGIHPMRSLRFFPHYSWVLLFPLVFWGLLAEPTARRWGVRILVIGAALAGFYGVAQHYTAAVWFIKTPEALPAGGYIAVGTLGHHLTYSGVLLPIFFLSLGMILDQRPRWLWALASAGILLGLIFSAARSAWIGLAAGILLFGFLRGRRWFVGTALTGALVLAAILVLSPSMRARAVTLADVGDDPRLRLWQTALRIGADYPVIGAGIGSFGSLFPTYKVPGWYLAHGHPHSDPLNILVETGAIGVAAWFGIWTLFFLQTRGRRDSGLPRSPQAASPQELLEPDVGPVRDTDSSRQGRIDGLRAAMFALLVAGFGQCFSSDEEVAQAWWFCATAGLVYALEPGRDRKLSGSRLRPDPRLRPNLRQRPDARPRPDERPQSGERGGMG